MSHQAKMKPKNLADVLTSFQSNEDRKREQRMRYKSEYKGLASRWMGSGIKPPPKGKFGGRVR